MRAEEGGSVVGGVVWYGVGGVGGGWVCRGLGIVIRGGGGIGSEETLIGLGGTRALLLLLL